ncbi:MAG TPA: DinB family protein [Vicinamibacterales bacterium]|nr:DinB family protein [Vicinamibacterales bacterium]
MSEQKTMTIGEARDLMAYNRWANGLVFDAAKGLTSEQYREAIPSSFPSVAATLAHIVSTEWVWLRRWLGESPTSGPEWVAAADLAELRTRLTTIESERDGFLAGLTDADLDQPMSYRTLAGQPHADRLSDVVRHVVNHSTYHRGQAATQFRQLDVAPPGTDFIAYVWKARRPS